MNIGFVSVDIEADGKYLGQNSMLSIGAVAYDYTGNTVSDFYKKLETVEGGVAEHRCMEEFWAWHMDMYKEATTDPEFISEVMETFVQWIKALPFDRVFLIAKPSVYDGAWVSYYVDKYTTYDSIRLKWLDLGTLKFTLRSLGGVTNKLQSLEGAIVKNNKQQHHALYDAIEQGEVFFLYFNAIQRMSNMTLKEILRF